MPIRVGDIVYVDGLLEHHPDKKKYAVAISIAPNLVFMINTENRAIYDCIPLLKKGRRFPDYDSFIGCKNVFSAPDTSIVRHAGKLDNGELRDLLAKVQASKHLSKVQKDSFTANINAELTLRAKGK